jgi:NAD(P)-dependent dehydrogenase (short-subunit alcohol dehydrogenase family)
MPRMLHGKACLVTGAGSGIGRATAIAMARNGARVLAADLPDRGAQETASTIVANGGTAHAALVDVTDEAQVAAMLAACIVAFGRLDCAHNNAGVSPGQIGAGGKRTGDIGKDAWDRIIAVNLTGVWLCMKHELAAMEATGGGAIVNTASIAGLVGLPHSHAYVAAKHGVVGLTKAAAIDHAEAGVRVNAVCPGYIDTPMIRDSMARRGNSILARPPMHRLGTAEEIADAVVWLLSDQARFVTGTALPVDGGFTAA